MQHLQAELIGQQGFCIWLFAPPAHHRGFQLAVAAQQGDLTVGVAGIVAHAEQALPQQGPADGSRIESPVPHHSPAAIALEAQHHPQLRLQPTGILQAGLPLPLEPVRVDQIRAPGPRQRSGQLPLRPGLEPFGQRSCALYGQRGWCHRPQQGPQRQQRTQQRPQQMPERSGERAHGLQGRGRLRRSWLDNGDRCPIP